VYKGWLNGYPFFFSAMALDNINRQSSSGLMPVFLKNKSRLFGRSFLNQNLCGAATRQASITTFFLLTFSAAKSMLHG
jgi:hypothetical protein